MVKGLGHTISGGYNSNGLLFGKDSISKSTSTFVKAFQNAGFIVIGQTNFPEMGLKNITNSKLYGPTGSAWNSAYQAGGSSGGSATAVAAGYTPIGTGSDLWRLYSNPCFLEWNYRIQTFSWRFNWKFS